MTRVSEKKNENRKSSVGIFEFYLLTQCKRMNDELAGTTLYAWHEAAFI